MAASDFLARRPRGGDGWGGPAAAIGFAIPIVCACVAAGFLVARGGRLAYGLLALPALLVAAILFSRRLDLTLFSWLALEGVAYPVLRYPLHHNLATFDRFVVFGLGGSLVLSARRGLDRDGRRLTWALGAFVVAYGLRAFFTTPLPVPENYGAVASYQPQADWLDQALLPFILFVAATQALTTRARWLTLTKVLSLLGATVAFLGLTQWVTGLDLSRLSGFSPFFDPYAGVTRVSGPYGDPTTYGSVLVVCLAATIYLLQSERRSLLVFGALALEIVGLAPSLTKTLWVGAFVVAVIGFGVRRRITARTGVVALYAAGLVGFVYSLLQSSPVVAERVTGSNGNVLARLGDYVQGIYIFEHWPLAGAGINQFISAQQFVPSVTVGGVVATPSPHNTFISVLAEGGLLGFIPLVVVVWAIIKLVRAVRRRAATDEEVRFGSTLLAATIGYLLMSLTLVQIYYPVATMLLAVLLGAGAGRLRGREPPPTPHPLR